MMKQPLGIRHQPSVQFAIGSGCEQSPSVQAVSAGGAAIPPPPDPLELPVSESERHPATASTSADVVRARLANPEAVVSLGKTTVLIDAVV
jgi:hypothetical protein